MADVVAVPKIWTALDSLTGVSPAEYYLQNVGQPADLVECVLAASTPPESVMGFQFDQLKKTYRVTPLEGVRPYVRFRRIDKNEDTYSRTGFVYWQEVGAVSIAEVDQIPGDLFTSDVPGNRRLTVSATSREEVQISRGEFFVGSSLRAGVTVTPGAPTYYYSVVEAPPDKYLVIEDVIQTLDFSAVASGQFNHQLDAFVEGSATSSYTYTPGAPVPIGRALNTEFINQFPTSTVDLGVTASTAGDAEYPIFYQDFYVDTQGNRNQVTQSATDFFGKARQIVLAPGGQALVRATSTGDATGSVDIRTIFFTSEVSLEDAPTILNTP